MKLELFLADITDIKKILQINVTHDMIVGIKKLGETKNDKRL